MEMEAANKGREQDSSAESALLFSPIHADPKRNPQNSRPLRMFPLIK